MLRCLLLGSPQQLGFFPVFAQPTTCPLRFHTWRIRESASASAAAAAALGASIETVLRSRRRRSQGRVDQREEGCGMLQRPAVGLSVSRSGSRENGGAAVARMLGGGGDIISIISSSHEASRCRDTAGGGRGRGELRPMARPL
ncbi:hypothetical protein CgunFtcFv8_023422 [Champsocephalus gunnari]|uniref:Uncharacterized protein n=1 Tax=Champsocephalus gunnari TaxID=52237 RepID=A0AAN8HLE0_CHAGU|nr:hypothetical protein CgunFtcFv8_023422 [Champsocephalus gunnari]